LEPELSREDTAVSTARVVRSPRFIVFAIILVTILSVVGIIALRRSAIFSGTTDTLAAPVSRDLIYPGSRVVLDLTEDKGAAVLQLETSDPLNKVQAWYMAQLKPDKVLQATIKSAILRRQNVTVTIITESNNTTIVIKQGSH
jgi:hypothetical protein